MVVDDSTICKVVCTDEFIEWYDHLSGKDSDTVTRAVELLELGGIALGTPHSSSIVGSKFPFRELRPKQGHSPLRVIYVFDPQRDAILLIGGDKSGDKRFYSKIITRSEEIYEQYIDERRNA